jgi:hypothetical protein
MGGLGWGGFSPLGPRGIVYEAFDACFNGRRARAKWYLMAAFAVLAPPDNHVIADVIERNFPRRFHITQGQFLVAESGLTAQQVAEKIGLNGAAGQFAVVSIAGFFGYHRKDLWEWLTLNSN